jgi:hypothetical protein
VSLEKKKWRNCTESKDGIERSGKGWCYIDEECRKRFLVGKKCRNKRLFCAYADVECMKRFKLTEKILISPHLVR